MAEFWCWFVAYSRMSYRSWFWYSNILHRYWLNGKNQVDRKRNTRRKKPTTTHSVVREQNTRTRWFIAGRLFVVIFFLSYQSFSSHCIISFIIYICVYVLITSALWKHVTYCFLFFESCIRDGWFFYSFSNFVCFFFRCRFSHMLCTNKTQQKFNLV